MSPRAFWCAILGVILGADAALAAGEANGDTACEVAYVGCHFDRPGPRLLLALGLAALWRHLVKPRPWLDTLKET